MRAFVRSLSSLGVLLAVGASLASAQSTPPRLTIASGPGTSSWPGVGARVDEDAYLTVIAVTRGLSNYPAQVLFPGNPSDLGKVSAGVQVRLRSLDDRDLVHLVSMGEAPLIIGFASRTPPNRDGFVVNRRWGTELYLETESSTPEGLAKELATILFGSEDAVYDVAIRGASRPLTTARSMAFNGNAPMCDAFGAGYSVYGRLGAGQVRYVSSMSSFGAGIFVPGWSSYRMSWLSGFPLPGSNGQLYMVNSVYDSAPAGGCEIYRVAWYPFYDPELAYFYGGPGTRRTRPTPNPMDTLTKTPTDDGTSGESRRHPRGLPIIDPTRATGVFGDRVRAMATTDGATGIGRRIHPRTMLGDLLDAKDRTALDGSRRTAEWDGGTRGRNEQRSDAPRDRDVRRADRDREAPADEVRGNRNTVNRRDVADEGRVSNGQTRERQVSRPVNEGDDSRRAPRATPPQEPRVAAPEPRSAPVESRRVERTVDVPSKAPAGNPNTP